MDAVFLVVFAALFVFVIIGFARRIVERGHRSTQPSQDDINRAAANRNFVHQSQNAQQQAQQAQRQAEQHALDNRKQFDHFVDTVRKNTEQMAERNRRVAETTRHMAQHVHKRH